MSRIKYLSLELRSVFYSALNDSFSHSSITATLYGEILRITMYLKLQCFKEEHVKFNILENQYENLESAPRTLNILSFDQNVFHNKDKTMYEFANGLVPQ